ncbi:MAG: hypothetical protein K9H48_16360 [Melioribacteraceae bacterium]|nr:hypothetical protein [Melioribacteraceae bacterium]MCF8394411.1 hypothetical protein [Melioribacteraceae bacterium]MCF8417493.1 hypothetical protein [Melioribacteraceae bacterium]
MKEISIKKYIRYLFGTATLVFIMNKLYLRSWILENDVHNIFQIVTYSIPNLIEAIIGTLILTGILLQARQYFNQKLGNLKDVYIYTLAVSVASIYVISQELKFHNLGGNNVYDPYDLIASIVGLVGTFVIIQNFGFVNKVERDKNVLQHRL